MSKTVVVIGSMASAMVLACMAAVLTAVPGATQTQMVTLVGAGDIAGCDFKADRKTARLLGRISGTVFTLGDNVYPEHNSASATTAPGASTRSARGPRLATKTTTPPGRSPISITSDGVRGRPPEATTPTTWAPGT
jgi:hypothetical protein